MPPAVPVSRPGPEFCSADPHCELVLFELAIGIGELFLGDLMPSGLAVEHERPRARHAPRVGSAAGLKIVYLIQKASGRLGWFARW